MLTIVSVALATAAPMITKQIKHNNLSNVQSNILGRNINSVQNDVRVQRTAINDIQGDVQVQETVINNVSRSVAANTAAIEELQAALGLVRGDIRALQNRNIPDISGTNNRVAQLESQYTALDEQLNTLNS